MISISLQGGLMIMYLARLFGGWLVPYAVRVDVPRVVMDRCAIPSQLPFASSHFRAPNCRHFISYQPPPDDKMIAHVHETVATSKAALQNARESVAMYPQNATCLYGDRTEKTRVSGHRQSLTYVYTSVPVYRSSLSIYLLLAVKG